MGVWVLLHTAFTEYQSAVNKSLCILRPGSQKPHDRFSHVYLLSLCVNVEPFLAYGHSVGRDEARMADYISLASAETGFMSM